MRSAMFRLCAPVLLLAGFAAPSASPQSLSAGSPFDGAMAELRQTMAGKEGQPAEAVFKNIQLLKGIQAVRVLRIMESGFTRALGVKCSHCHDAKSWSSDDKKEKRIARDMMRMMQDINGKYLPSISGLKSDTPAVSCATCHRGRAQPLLGPEPPLQ